MRDRTYRYFTGRPEYPFGYGLSFTHFGYSRLKLQRRELRAGSAQHLSVEVRNDDRRAGDEVVQLYVSPVGRSDAPRRSVKGFERIHLRPGEARLVEFDLMPRDLAFADSKGTMRVSPGDYQLWVGGGQQGTGAPGAAATFHVAGELALQP
jgi:beta-glucosidase